MGERRVSEHEKLLRAMFEAGVASARPALCLARFMPLPAKGRTIITGAGKASAAMAAAFETHWTGSTLTGLVVTRYGYSVPCQHIEIIEASHPVPDAAGEAAARRMLALVQGLSADDVVVALISGGASSLLCLPGAGLSLADKQAVNQALLASGAAIGEMNVVRKQLSAIKGGRLAEAAFPAKVITLAISDVPGDDFSLIGSGPAVPDNSTPDEAIAILAKYAISAPGPVMARLTARARHAGEKPAPAMRTEARMIAAPAMALAAAERVAHQAGYAVTNLGDDLEGEARQVARAHARLARALPPRSVLLSGGELTVTLAANAGKGGPNSEYALALAIALDGAPDIYALACDTDGIDGSQDNAGAQIGPGTLARAAAAGVSAGEYLKANDAWTFFQRTGGLVVTGPTMTNVNDLRAIIKT